MKAIVLEGPKRVSLRKVRDPKPMEGEVKIRVRRVGICGTDKAMYLGDYLPESLPLILGHEISGEVVEVGEGVPEEILGKRVTTEINLSCGSCYFCRHGMKTHCPYRRILGINCDGGMAEYVITRAEAIHSVEGLRYSEGAMVEPLAAAIRTIELCPPGGGEKIAIIGAGTISLLSLQIFKEMTGEIYLISRENEFKRRLALKLGARDFMSVKEAEEFVKENTPEGLGFDYVLEGTGSPEGVNLAISLARPMGTVVLKSTHGKSSEVDVTSAVVKELKIFGTRCGPFEKAIEAIRKGKVDVNSLVTHVFPFEEFEEAFSEAFSRESVKVQLEL